MSETAGKSAAQLKKEAKKKEKLEKFDAKKGKQEGEAWRIAAKTAVLHVATQGSHISACTSQLVQMVALFSGVDQLQVCENSQQSSVFLEVPALAGLKLVDPLAMAEMIASEELQGGKQLSARCRVREVCNWALLTVATQLHTAAAKSTSCPPSLTGHLTQLNTWLATVTWLVGDRITIADLAVYTTLRGFSSLGGTVRPDKGRYPHVNRWFTTLANQPQCLKLASGATTSTEDSVNAPPKSKVQLKKEAKKLEKLAKFEAKKVNFSAPGTGSQKKDKAAASKAQSGDQTDEASIKAKTVPNVAGCEMPKTYNPSYVEAHWYSWWEHQKYFQPEYRPELMDASPDQSFTLMIPPPNVTGSLHLGHALTNSVEDAIVRWHRMCGHRTLWSPGMDHAGIATQVVVEKKLWREQQRTRHQLGREAFVKEVWKWKNEKGDLIYKQLRALGSSCDWTRERFTMDEKMSRAVTESFVLLHDQGLITRSKRLVNWSCTLKSAISDMEVDKQELAGITHLHVPGYKETVEFGVLVSFAYKVQDSDEEVVVATTRIETMLGDSAVAVHPDDPRYKHLHGRFVVHPFVPERRLPVVADSFVERDFGTGAVKITPAHDPNDFEVGNRHDLPFITMIDDSGCISPGCGEFSGMKRFHARKAVLEALKKLDLYRGTQPNPMVVPICSRSKDIIEPLVKPQWYLKCQEMADEAMRVVETGELKIIPEMHKKTWFSWLKDCRDWCISRQLWWGHQIPAYRIQRSQENMDEQEDNDDNWVVGRTPEEALERAAQSLMVDASSLTLHRDEDVLDTWFSAQLFPFAVFDWPDETLDLSRFYPGSLLETGHDILFFWVARMVMVGLRLMGKLPFREVYLHAMVRDAHGKKMSKSLGNAIDPLDVIHGITLEELYLKLEQGNLEPRDLQKARNAQQKDFPKGIPECGTDALRFALCAYTSQGRDINLDVLRVQGYRFFCNKLWNAARYALHYSLKDFTPPASMDCLYDNKDLSPVDRWMLSRLSQAVATVNSGFETYDFPKATTSCYNLWLYDLCDVYLEYTKQFAKDDSTDQRAAIIRHVLYTSMEVGLRLLHPFMPFVTEELFQRFPRRQAPGNASSTIVSISVASYPKIAQFPWINEELESSMKLATSTLHTVRSMRSHYRLAKTQIPEACLVTEDQSTVELLSPFVSDLIEPLGACKVTKIMVRGSEGLPPHCVIGTVSSRCSVHLDLQGLINPAQEAERLTPQVKKLTDSRDKLTREIARPDYKDKVPETVRALNTQKLSELETELHQLEEALSSLRSMQ